MFLWCQKQLISSGRCAKLFKAVISRPGFYMCERWKTSVAHFSALKNNGKRIMQRTGFRICLLHVMDASWWRDVCRSVHFVVFVFSFRGTGRWTGTSSMHSLEAYSELMRIQLTSWDVSLDLQISTWHRWAVSWTTNLITHFIQEGLLCSMNFLAGQTSCALVHSEYLSYKRQFRSNKLFLVPL